MSGPTWIRQRGLLRRCGTDDAQAIHLGVNVERLFGERIEEGESAVIVRGDRHLACESVHTAVGLDEAHHDAGERLAVMGQPTTDRAAE